MQASPRRSRRPVVPHRTSSPADQAHFRRTHENQRSTTIQSVTLPDGQVPQVDRQSRGLPSGSGGWPADRYHLRLTNHSAEPVQRSVDRQRRSARCFCQLLVVLFPVWCQLLEDFAGRRIKISDDRCHQVLLFGFYLSQRIRRHRDAPGRRTHIEDIILDKRRRIRLMWHLASAENIDDPFFELSLKGLIEASPRTAAALVWDPSGGMRSADVVVTSKRGSRTR